MYVHTNMTMTSKWNVYTGVRTHGGTRAHVCTCVQTYNDIKMNYVYTCVYTHAYVNMASTWNYVYTCLHTHTAMTKMSYMYTYAHTHIRSKDIKMELRVHMCAHTHLHNDIKMELRVRVHTCA